MDISTGPSGPWWPCPLLPHHVLWVVCLAELRPGVQVTREPVPQLSTVRLYAADPSAMTPSRGERFLRMLRPEEMRSA